MTDVLSLFDVPADALVRVSDPVTSARAARSITPGRMEQPILDVFRASPYRGFTDDELVAELPALYGPSVKTARSRLASSKDGRVPLLVDSGKRRLSDRGRDQIVWVLAPSR